MTLCVAFVRKCSNSNREELVFASDSRLSGGQRLDAGQKIFGLPRSDALLAFCGDTTYAYTLVHHMIATVDTYARSRDRRFPLESAKGHMLRVFSQLYRDIHGFPVGETEPIEDHPRVQFIFGGYSWHTGRFRIWYIRLNRQGRMFEFGSAPRFHFIGDRPAVKSARDRTTALLREKGHGAHVDYEPLKAMLETVCDPQHDGVGGVPQVAKVYQRMSKQFFATRWPLKPATDESAILHVFGRPLLPLERISWPEFDFSKV